MIWFIQRVFRRLDRGGSHQKCEKRRQAYGNLRSRVIWISKQFRVIQTNSDLKDRKTTFFALGILASGDHVPDDAAGDVGETEVAAGIAVGELLVIEPEELKDGSVQVVDMNFLFGGSEAEFVGRAI